jgi:hypothetical protein
MPNREAAEWVITDGRNPEKHRQVHQIVVFLGD